MQLLGKCGIKAIYAFKALSADNPVVIEATKIIEERKDFLVDMFPEGGGKEYLVWAIPEISIGRHINTTYLDV